jgi:hypothetical protein
MLEDPLVRARVQTLILELHEGPRGRRAVLHVRCLAAWDVARPGERGIAPR